ncbi:MAG: IS3 family transposase, partial [Coriobacteriales bacterium]|nr:IS3 family transposase [Coriobacteriales bacterium]
FRGRDWSDFESFKRDLEAYIHHWNHVRRQARLKGLTPVEFRDQALRGPPSGHDLSRPSFWGAVHGCREAPFSLKAVLCLGFSNATQSRYAQWSIILINKY